MALPQGGREVGEGIQIVVAILHTFTFGVGNALKNIGIKLQWRFFILFAGGDFCCTFSANTCCFLLENHNMSCPMVDFLTAHLWAQI